MQYFYESQKSEIRLQPSRVLDYGAHLHEHIELLYIKRGYSDLYIEDKKYELHKGDFVAIFPNQIHRYENSTDIIAQILIFSPQVLPEYKKLFSSQIPISPIVDVNNSLTELYEIFWREYWHLDYETAHGFILAIMGMMLEGAKLENFDQYDISTIKSILMYSDEHYTEPITIENVSEALGISRFHIAHVLNNKLGTTFSEYIAKKRVDYACTVLKDRSTSITDAAFMSGFNSIRTFNRVFLRYAGLTPREYRRKNQNN